MTMSNATTGDVTSSPNTIPFDSLPLVQLSVWIWTICLPVLFILGVFGNVMTIVIVRRFRDNRSALDCYFLYLAVTDLCVNVTGQLPDWLTVVTGFDVFAVHDIVCKMDFFVLSTAMTSSGWVVVVMVTHRAMSVAWPHRVNVMCTPKTSWAIIVSIFIIFALAKSHLFYGMEVLNNRCMPTKDYMEFLANVWVRIDIVKSALLPFCCLLVSNVVLVVKLRTSVKEAGDQFAATDRQQSVRERKVNSITLTVLAVSVSFIAFKIPICVLNILDDPAFGSLKTKSSDDKAHSYFLQHVCLCFAYVNYSANFSLYCLTGKRFRTEFLSVMRGLLVGTTSPEP